MFNLPILRKYASLVHEDLTSTYSRDIQKWLIFAPIIGVVTGVVIAGVALVILRGVWAFLLPLYYAYHWLILPGLLVGFVVTGLLMAGFTEDPDEHSTEEIIRAYHEHGGYVNLRPFWIKLLAAVTTVGSGGSAALEGPSIYGGGAIGSWLWDKFRRFGLTDSDRRVMLISGAAAGMAAVFRAPLTGLIFALEMPYRDDLAHEALLPSLIASVVAYATLVTLLGSEPLFGFTGTTVFSSTDLMWSALLGLICGVLAMIFAITFRRARTFAVHAPIHHVWKMVIGAIGTGLCGLLFVSLFSVPLMPLGPNYEAVREILAHPHSSAALLVFAVTKLAATLFSLGVGGVSAMFVPLLAAGGAIGNVFAQSVVHSPTVDLYAAVGMASFIAAAYKTPLAAVVFVAETTGGHSFIIPTLVGAAVAYAVSGEASVSGDQHLHEQLRISELTAVRVSEVMHPDVVGVPSNMSLKEFAETVAHRHDFQIFPVFEQGKVVGLMPVRGLSGYSAEQWDKITVKEAAGTEVVRIGANSALDEALRLLARTRGERLLLVTTEDGSLVGVLTPTDVIRVMGLRGNQHAGGHQTAVERRT